MEEISFWAIVIAGIAATVVMNIFTYLFGLITRNNFHPVLLLGTLASMETTKKGKLSSSKKALSIGLFLYFFLGVVIALIYGFLWRMGWGSPDLIGIIIYGFFTGLLAIGAWNMLLSFHPNPPKLRLADHFSPILIGHVIYAVNFLYLYGVLR